MDFSSNSKLKTQNSKLAILLPIYSLWKRELILFIRQPSLIIGTIGLPLVFWFVFGLRAQGEHFQALFATAAIFVIVSASIGSSYTVISDHNLGFLKSLLVSPVSNAQLVFGKILGCATTAMLQALIFLLLAPHLTFEKAVLSIAGLFVVALTLCSFGFLLAWPMDSAHGFHLIVNLALIPMWLLSGGLFGMTAMPNWLNWIVKLNPLYYATQGLSGIFFLESSSNLMMISQNLAIVFSFGAVLFLICLFMVKLRTRSHLD